MSEIHEGTVSHDTLRSEDLIVTFFTLLMELDPSTANQLTDGSDPNDERVLSLLTIKGSTTLPDDLAEHATEMVIWLTDALNDAGAPHGFRFGTIEGDGSDYGFWRTDEDEDEA